MAKESALSADDKAFLETPPGDEPLDEQVEADDDEEIGEDAKARDADKPAAEAATDKDKADKDKPAKDDKATPEKQVMVPHGAMEKERREKHRLAKELADERQAAAERNARLEERFAILSEALKPPPQAPPNPDEDIFAAYRHLEGKFNESQQAQQQRDQQQQEQARQSAAMQQLTTAYVADAGRFKRETPDFDEAYQHLLRSRHDELAAIGYDEPTIANAIRQDELNIADFQLRNGGSPAETIYNLAKQRGYKSKAEQEAETKPNGADQAKPDGVAEIERLKNAQDASTSLSQGGCGPGGAQKITLESIDRMSKDEFKTFVAKVNKRDPHGFDKLQERLMLGRA